MTERTQSDELAHRVTINTLGTVAISLATLVINGRLSPALAPGVLYAAEYVERILSGYAELAEEQDILDSFKDES